MSSISNFKAYCLGAAVVVAVPSLAGAYLMFKAIFSLPVAIILYGSVVSSGFITAWFAQSRKVALATLLALPFAASMVIANAIHYLMGFPTDTPGIYGAWVVTTVSLPVGVLLCGTGGVMGWWASRSKHNNRLQRTGQG